MATRAPIDRGWAWVITFAVFCTNILCVGYFRAFGVFFVEIIDTFHSSSSLTSLIMGVQNAVCCVVALLVHNVLLDVIEVRTSAVLGGSIMAVGMMLGMFAHSVPFLILTLSVLVGAGNAFTYGPGIVLLGQYFSQRRALANALASMGASVGSMVLPLMATYLLLHYGLRGGLLLYGAVTFHICVFASLYRPLSRAHIAASLVQNPDSSVLESGTDSGKALLVSETNREDEKPGGIGAGQLQRDSRAIPGPTQKASGIAPEGEKLSPQQDVPPLSMGDSLVNRGQSRVSLPTESQGSNQYPDPLPRINVLSSSLPFVGEKDQETFSPRDLDPRRLLLKNVEADPRQFSSTGNMRVHSEYLKDDAQRSLTFTELRTPSFLRLNQQGKASSSASQLRLRLENAALRLSQPHLLVHPPFLHDKLLASASSDVQNSYDVKNSEDDVTDSDDVTTSDDVSADDARRSGACKKLCEKVSCDGELLRTPMFWLVQCYVCVGVMGATGAGSYVPVFMQEKGLTKNETALTLTIWGAFNLVGRLCSGLVADRKLLRPANVSALAFVGIGLLFASVSFMPRTLVAMCAFSAVFGLLEGVYFSMLPDIIIGFVSLRNFSRTFGFAQLSQGAFAAMLYPILGGLKDITGSYHATFYLLGACAFMATFLLWMVPILRTCRQLFSGR